MARSIVSRLAPHRSPVDIGFIIGACALVFVGALSYLNTRELRNEAAWVRRTYEVLRLLPEVDDSFAPAMTSDAKRGLLMAKVDALQSVTSDNRTHQDRIDTLRSLITERNQPEFHALIRRMQVAERTLLDQRTARTEARAVRTTRIVTVSPPLEDGRVQIIARDITERKEVERMKDEFISLVSHELRTPLTSIRGAIGLLASGRLAQDEAKQIRMLDLAAVNTDRLFRLINDILDVERINSGAVTFERTASNARELVESSVEALRPIAERSGVALNWSCADMRIWADPDRIIQTLTNLIGNAIKFSPPGSVVHVAARKDGTIALFEVRDQGRGIPQDKLASVFDRFQQVDASDSREKAGTGLGLAISRGIVEQQGGRIWAESTSGQESVFSFTIPLFPDDIAGPADRARRSVLICDDDEDMVEVLAATLAAHGCTAFGVHSGNEAIARFDASPSEVVIIELMLPDISGRDVIRHIHSTAPQTCIIVYSAAYIADTDCEAIRSTRARVFSKGRTNLEQLASEVALLVDRKTITPTESVA